MMWLSNHDIVVIIVLAVLAGVALGVGDGLSDKKLTSEFYKKIFYMITGGLWFGAVVLAGIVEFWSDQSKWTNLLFGLWIIPLLGIFAFFIHGIGVAIAKKLDATLN